MISDFDVASVPALEVPIRSGSIAIVRNLSRYPRYQGGRRCRKAGTG